MLVTNNVSNEFELHEYFRYSRILSPCKSSTKQMSKFNSMSEDKYENGIASIYCKLWEHFLGKLNNMIIKKERKINQPINKLGVLTQRWICIIHLTTLTWIDNSSFKQIVVSLVSDNYLCLLRKLDWLSFSYEKPLRVTDREEDTSFKEEGRGKGVNIVL